ncbi:MAG: SLBB domain-containing protein [Lachnospiraceae bacterium]|nr:SLBB domain-containing protein [Lachnospiraceae bacterium]
MNIKELSSRLQENGVVGAGGAGFPTYAKLDQRAETILLNCAECEPLLQLHKQMLEVNVKEIVAGFHLIGQAVAAKELMIGIKKEYKKTIAALEEVLPQYPEMTLGLMDGIYPAGDEQVLVYELTGKVVPPGGIPIDVGIAVFNVETVYNAYRAFVANEPVVEKLVSVVAEVAHPMTVKVPIGLSFDEVVALAGGSTIPNPVYFIGGPMMGYIGKGHMPVTKTTNAIMVLSKDHYLIQKKRKKTSIDIKRAAACCCQCTMCTDLCPRNLLGHPIEPHKFMLATTCKDVQESDIFLNTLYCCSCGLCELYSCFQELSPRALMDEYKEGLRKKGIRPSKEVKVKPIPPGRAYRQVYVERLMARIDLARYDKDAPIEHVRISLREVKINLSQHIGAPAKAIVQVGDRVCKGQMIGKPADGLSVGIHASISGIVTEVTEGYVIMRAQEG